MYDHMQKISSKIKAIAQSADNKLHPVAPNFFTGIPRKDLKKWLNKDYSSIEGELDAYSNKMNSLEINLQATAGILPSSIRALFMCPSSSSVSIKNALDILQKTALDDVNGFFMFWKDIPYIANLKKSGHFDSFFGIILLLYSYLLGNTFEQIQCNMSTPKNDVPFLCKLSDMRDIFLKAAPNLPPPDDVFSSIIRLTMENSPSVEPENLRNILYQQSGLQQGKSNTIPDDLLPHRYPRAHIITSRNIYDILRRSPDEIFILSSGKVFNNPDNTYDPLNIGQKGIPLEFRNIREQVTVDNLPNVCQQIMLQIKTLNTTP